MSAANGQGALDDVDAILAGRPRRARPSRGSPPCAPDRRPRGAGFVAKSRRYVGHLFKMVTSCPPGGDFPSVQRRSPISMPRKPSGRALLRPNPDRLSGAVSLIGRVGYAARSTIYFLVGASASLAAVRPGASARRRRRGAETAAEATRPGRHLVPARRVLRPFSPTHTPLPRLSHTSTHQAQRARW